MDERQAGEQRRWIYVGVLTILGLAMIWWGAEQFTQIRMDRSDFRFPPGRLLGLLVTLVGAGLVFGLASPPGPGLDRRRRVAVAGWSLLLVVVLGAFFSVLALNWPEPGLLPSELLRFLTSPITVTGASLALGFYLSRLTTGHSADAEVPR